MTGVFYVPLRQHGGGTHTEYESAHKVTLEKKILPPLLPGFELATLDHESGTQAIQARVSSFPDWFPHYAWTTA